MTPAKPKKPAQGNLVRLWARFTFPEPNGFLWFKAQKKARHVAGLLRLYFSEYYHNAPMIYIIMKLPKRNNAPKASFAQSRQV